jgi:hypothetical protein
MVSNPFKEGNCGGRRLNQYAITLGLMFEQLPTPANQASATAMSQSGGSRALPLPPSFAPAISSSPFAAGFGSSTAAAGSTEACYPIFSTAAYAETEVWLHFIMN